MVGSNQVAPSDSFGVQNALKSAKQILPLRLPLSLDQGGIENRKSELTSDIRAPSRNQANCHKSVNI